LNEGFKIQEWDAIRLNEFAELIVRECSDLFEIEWGEEKLTGNDVGYVLKKHFGVEEPEGWVCNKCGTDRTKSVCPYGHNAALTGECPMVGVAQ